jgi:hypothetical protein
MRKIVNEYKIHRNENKKNKWYLKVL